MQKSFLQFSSGQSGDLTPIQRIERVAGWSLSVALLLGIGNAIWEMGQENFAYHVVKSTVMGLVSGAIFGAIHARIIKGWRSGAVAGTILGLIGGVTWWATITAFGIDVPQSGLLLLGITLGINMVGGLVAGVLFALLLAERSRSD